MSACSNCFHPLAEPPLNYCGHCGQETRVRPPTLMDFLQQFGGAYFSTEGALWRTLRLLLLRPGQLTLEYLAGRRRHYVLPLRLYLTISLIALLALKIGGGLALEREVERTGTTTAFRLDTDGDTQLVDIGSWRAGIAGGRFYCENLPGNTCERLRRRLDQSRDAAGQLLELQAAKDRFMSHGGTAMFVLLPCFALWTQLLFIDRKRYYTEHLVFALHLHAFWFLMVLLAVATPPWGRDAAMLASAIYPLVALQRVFGTRWWSTGLRALALFLINLTTISFTMAAVVLLTLFS